MQQLLRIHFVILVFAGMLFSSVTGYAQYSGGVDDGHTNFNVINLPLGMNFFTGSTDDGFNNFFGNNIALGQNFFMGGIDDGSSVSTLANTALGLNIFTGGVDDGTTFFQAPTIALGQNIFTGGTDDGITTTATSSLPLGNNFFTGGANDGWAFSLAINVALPIVLKSFDVSWKNDKDVLCRWVTTSEINTHHFEVERSTNSITFTIAGSLTAAGNSGTERTYSFIDYIVNDHYSTRPAFFFYRLKSIDNDGKITYSAIVALPNKQQSPDGFVVYPNPAEQLLTIEFKSGGTLFKPHNMLLYTSDGKLLSQKLITAAKQTINVGIYPSGNYYIRIIEPFTNSAQTIKFIIQH